MSEVDDDKSKDVRKKKESEPVPFGWLVGVAGLVVIGGVAMFLYSLVFGGVPTAKYSAHLVNVGASNSAKVVVYWKVTNTGTKAGKPRCIVTVSSPGGAFTGYDGRTAHSAVQPGATQDGHGTIYVARRGAGQVDVADSTITCQ